MKRLYSPSIQEDRQCLPNTVNRKQIYDKHENEAYNYSETLIMQIRNKTQQVYDSMISEAQMKSKIVMGDVESNNEPYVYKFKLYHMPMDITKIVLEYLTPLCPSINKEEYDIGINNLENLMFVNKIYYVLLTNRNINYVWLRTITNYVIRNEIIDKPHPWIILTNNTLYTYDVCAAKYMELIIEMKRNIYFWENIFDKVALISLHDYAKLRCVGLHSGIKPLLTGKTFAVEMKDNEPVRVDHIKPELSEMRVWVASRNKNNVYYFNGNKWIYLGTDHNQRVKLERLPNGYRSPEKHIGLLPLSRNNYNMVHALNFKITINKKFYAVCKRMNNARS